MAGCFFDISEEKVGYQGDQPCGTISKLVNPKLGATMHPVSVQSPRLIDHLSVMDNLGLICPPYCPREEFADYSALCLFRVG